MLTHPLKAWSLDGWGMPIASTGAATSSGAELLLVVTRSLSDYLRLKRSPGPKVRGMPSSTIGLPEGSFLVGLVTACSYPSRKIDLTRGFVLCEEEGTLDGTSQEVRGLDSSHLAQVAILVQTITSEFLKCTGRCCLYSLAWSGIAVVGWELSPLPST